MKRWMAVGSVGLLCACAGMLAVGCASEATDGSESGDEQDIVAGAGQSFVGDWTPASAADLKTAGFDRLTIDAEGKWSELLAEGDRTFTHGSYETPKEIDIAPDFGDPPKGLQGPYIDLAEPEGVGDGEWVFRYESPKADELTLTLFAARAGQGLRWAPEQKVIHLTKSLPLPIGSWKTAEADVAAAGFSSLVIGSEGKWRETGRPTTEDEGHGDTRGFYGSPRTIDIPKDFGDPPKGLKGPFLDLVEPEGVGDGQWVYRYETSADGKSLTLTLFAARAGQGLRWAPEQTVIHLTK